MTTIPIAFDVLGTCYSLDAATQALEEAFAEQLPPAGAGVSRMALVVDDWFHSSQRDFTYLSMNDSYTPIAKCLATSLPRVLLMAGFSPPAGASIDSTPAFANPFSPAFLAPALFSLTRMTARPSLAPASALLHSRNRFKLWACTNGGAENTRNLYDLALGKEESVNWGVWSCDSVRTAKPAPAVYEAIWKSLVGDGERKGWFVASHSWDLHAAKKAGFKTAWVGYEEKVTCEEIYGRPDVVAVDLVDAAKQIIALES